MAATRTLRTTSPEATEAAAAVLAGELRPGDVLLLAGELAAGKTTFTRGLVAGLGGDPADVSSPSFVLVQTYGVAGGAIRRVHHVDLYRLDDSRAEQQPLGLDDLVADAAAVVAVEWPRRAFAASLPAAARVWRLRFEVADDEARSIEVVGPD